ncbi:NADPH-dependent F420 reductase [Chitinophaga sp. CF418]|uniref:NADPH-dependent F420 reductase n=1 Tax=Chitinophaga sp. CF418 TaxID=1855287 RepID=UPI00091FB71F|nr:NAD(P)-binding domain-containing protein [Chitinophaga sp. CF418]SHN22534.1 hypothetical protein SAMN05216311_10762 [Chitinophaga sp. CF418]
MKTKIGIIGAGAIGLAFAKQAAAAGHEVIISNSRGPASLDAVIKDLKGIQAGTKEAAAQADVIMIAVPWQHLDAAVAGLDLSGKIVFDPVNPIITPGFILPDLGGKTSSEVVAAKVPGAALVKVFNTLPPALITANPAQNGGNRVVFYSGDDKAAKEVTGRLLSSMGFAGIDLGGLVQGGRMQQFPGGPLAAIHLAKY